MRLFREKSYGTAVRGESQVWCFECDEDAVKGEDIKAWEIFSGESGIVVDFLNWNDGADRNGVVMLVDSVDVPRLKALMSDVRAELKAFRKAAG